MLSHKSCHAAILKAVCDKEGFRHLQVARHIKAYQSTAAKELLSLDQQADVSLNEAADIAAKDRAKELQVDERVRDEYKRLCLEAISVIRTIASTLHAFPRPEKYSRLPPLLRKEER